MPFQVTIASSLEKIKKGRAFAARPAARQALRGERVVWQAVLTSSMAQRLLSVQVESPFGDNVHLFRVQDVVVDVPATEDVPEEEDYLSLTPGVEPDVLVPIEPNTCRFSVGRGKPTAVWVQLDVPQDAAAGEYPVRLRFIAQENRWFPKEDVVSEMTVTVVPTALPEQSTIYTRWFYLDCIATVHGVPLFSEEHWALIEKYVAAAADMGINMLLVPTHTPPLDTEIGTARPCVQLVDIEKVGDTYIFGFEKFRRYIALCQKHGIRYFETAHMFTQWGAKCAPNIMVTENGETGYRFGWHVAANDPSYLAFLKQYVAAIVAEVQALGIAKHTYFHISDEPNIETMDTYKTAADMLRPLLGECKSMDALSDYAFYERGLVQCPVTSVAHIAEFLKHDIPEQWAYYCCGPQTVFPNSFLAMPSRRVRILGFLLYKYNIKGFLHWGLNYYNSYCSLYPIDPSYTTSCDGTYPSGDAFILHPTKDGVYTSVRGQVTCEAMQDVEVCRALEARIGREAVVRMIDEAAGDDLRFDNYPKTDDYLLSLRAAMIRKIAE